MLAEAVAESKTGFGEDGKECDFVSKFHAAVQERDKMRTLLSQGNLLPEEETRAHQQLRKANEKIDLYCGRARA